MSRLDHPGAQLFLISPTELTRIYAIRNHGGLDIMERQHLLVRMAPDYHSIGGSEREKFQQLSQPQAEGSAATAPGDFINRVSGIGAFSAAEKHSASTRRVSAGVMMPSSQSRAVA